MELYKMIAFAVGKPLFDFGKEVTKEFLLEKKDLARGSMKELFDSVLQQLLASIKQIGTGVDELIANVEPVKPVSHFIDHEYSMRPEGWKFAVGTRDLNLNGYKSGPLRISEQFFFIRAIVVLLEYHVTIMDGNERRAHEFRLKLLKEGSLQPLRDCISWGNLMLLELVVNQSLLLCCGDWQSDMIAHFMFSRAITDLALGIEMIHAEMHAQNPSIQCDCSDGLILSRRDTRYFMIRKVARDESIHFSFDGKADAPISFFGNIDDGKFAKTKTNDHRTLLKGILQRSRERGKSMYRKASMSQELLGHLKDDQHNQICVWLAEIHGFLGMDVPSQDDIEKFKVLQLMIIREMIKISGAFNDVLSKDQMTQRLDVTSQSVKIRMETIRPHETLAPQQTCN